jgi:predicted phage tail protein
MLTVRLHGHLEEKYGSEFQFEAATVREVIDALQANFDDFTEEFIKDQRAYNILVDAEAQEIAGCVLPIKTDSTIDIIPVIGGAGFLKALGLIIIGAILIVATSGAGLGFLASAAAGGSAFSGLAGLAVSAIGAVGATTVAALGWGLALAGVASLLAGPDGPDGGGAKSSSLSQTDNIIGQGMPIPVGYGRLMLGSFVISATSTSSYTQVSKAWTYENTETDTTEDTVIKAGPAEDVAGGTVRDDGYVIPATLFPGFTPERFAEIIAVNEVNLGGGTYEVVNHTTSSGITIATPIFKPRKVAGSYNGDSAINHRK